VLGYVPAKTDAVQHAAGEGVGSVALRVVNSGIVPEGHRMHITFAAEPDSIRAASYAFLDSTSGVTLFKTGDDLEGLGIGPPGAGILPIVSTPRFSSFDAAHSGFEAGSPTNVRFKVARLGGHPNARRPGYPDDLRIEFADAVVDTSVQGGGTDPTPAKFRVWAETQSGPVLLRFRFRDTDGDNTLSLANERIDVVTSLAAATGGVDPVWRVQLDTLGQADRGPIQPPGQGDLYRLQVAKPFGVDDLFAFTAHGERVDRVLADAAPLVPYVVPNPYVGAASFEPQRFADTGRGERRIEFRNLPQHCSVRIYTVRGELVQTLRHDGSTAGMVPWNLRTKDNLDVAPGLYIFQVDGADLGSHVGKFAVIK
jgi:hypothetical protein